MQAFPKLELEYTRQGRAWTNTRFVPMVREGRLIGSLVVSRNSPGEFPPATIELLRTFATQSALAIQNARLFREIEEKSDQHSSQLESHTRAEHEHIVLASITA
jgi:GAF domain-containing protein